MGQNSGLLQTFQRLPKTGPLAPFRKGGDPAFALTLIGFFVQLYVLLAVALRFTSRNTGCLGAVPHSLALIVIADLLAALLDMIAFAVYAQVYDSNVNVVLGSLGPGFGFIVTSACAPPLLLPFSSPCAILWFGPRCPLYRTLWCSPPFPPLSDSLLSFSLPFLHCCAPAWCATVTFVCGDSVSACAGADVTPFPSLPADWVLQLLAVPILICARKEIPKPLPLSSLEDADAAAV